MNNELLTVHHLDKKVYSRYWSAYMKDFLLICGRRVG